MKVKVLKHFLKGYSPLKSKFLINGFTFGFRIPYAGARKFRDCKNLLSARKQPLILKQKIIEEIKAKRVVGPFNEPPLKNLQVSPLGLVPKKELGEYRVIHHLSYPEGSSINDGISQTDKTVHYQNIDSAVKLIKYYGKGALLAKTDIEAAFRLVPVHPDSHDLMGFKVQDSYFYDKTLAMGLSISCQLFEVVSQALHWILKQKFKATSIVHILDDFLFVGPPNSLICNQTLESFLFLCNAVGVPIKQSKTVNPCTCLTFLGIELDARLMEARLPQEKLDKIKSVLQKYISRQKLKLQEIQSLVGLLNFACSVVVPGRCFLRRLIVLTRGLKKPHHRVRLNQSAKEDMRMWLVFIEQFNGKSLFLSDTWATSEILRFYTDASQLGFSAIFNRRWFYGTWPVGFENYHITIKELFPIVLAVETWGHLLQNQCIEFYTDNEAVSKIINRQTSKDATLMKLLRQLVLRTLKYNILFRSRHIFGRLNNSADALSRLQIKRFKRLAPDLNEETDPINVVALDL